jgi:hypothetical protein
MIPVHVDENFIPQSAASKPSGDYDLWSPSLWMITLSLSQQPASCPGIMIYETRVHVDDNIIPQSASQPAVRGLWSMIPVHMDDNIPSNYLFTT